jgi:hypothetical protein
MIPVTDFTKSFFTLLAEIFGVTDAPHGYILDNGQTGMLGTIDKLSAEVASAAPTPEHATIASHTAHVLFIVQLFAAFERGEHPAADWEGSWSTRVVDDAAWQALRQDLRAAYAGVVARLQVREEWPEPAIGAMMMLLAHCAYHVGEIRQRLLWVA